MIICQVDAQVLAMGKEDIEQELQAVGEVLAAIGGELIHADFSMGHGYLVAYVCAESELVVSDIFDASYFKVESILYLKPSCVDYPHLNLHQCLSEQNGRLASGLVVPVFTPAFQSRFPPNTPTWMEFLADRPANVR